MRAAKEVRGQVLIIVALVLPILILFVALAVDGGMAYVMKARLSKAVDAACLTTMKNLWQGETTAKPLGTHIFNANYGANPPTPTITVLTDSYGNKQVRVTATAPQSTFFARSLFRSWNVSGLAVSTRGHLVMDVILDRSGSMGPTSTSKGGAPLKTAVPIFVNFFDDSIDQVGLISFASYATSNINIAHNFQSPITNLVNTWDVTSSDYATNKTCDSAKQPPNAVCFLGGTFGTGTTSTPLPANGPPLSLADSQITSVPVVAGQNTTRVVVYFTDGLTNTIQDTFTCYDNKKNKITPSPLINYGGYDSGSTVEFFDPTNGTDWGNNGSGVLYGTSKICYQSNGTTAVTTFTSQQHGSQTINQTNVTADSKYRALQKANAMRAENPGTYIYTIGLGTGVDATFLTQLANDPLSSTYNSSLPAGQYFTVPDCPANMAKCNTELQTVFQTIAAKILLRLTQ